MGFARDVIAMSIVTTAVAGAEPQPCVIAGESPSLMELDAGHVRFCLTDKAGMRCYFVGLDDGIVAIAPQPPAIADPAPRAATTSTLQVTVAGAEISVCKPDGTGCKIVKSKLATDQASYAVVTEDGKHAAAWLASAWMLGGTTPVETYDVATSRRMAAFQVGTHDDPCVTLGFVGDTLVIGEQNCAGPDNTAWLATLTGKRIATLGDKQRFSTISTEPVRIKGTLWAFNSSEGDRIVLQDVKTGKVKQTIAIGAAASAGDAHMIGDARRLVVVFGGERAGEVAVVELASSRVTHFTPTRCKP